MAAWNSRGLRGSTFEELINQTNEQYEQMNLALIQKIPTPITPVKIDQGSRHITLAYFENVTKMIIADEITGNSKAKIESLQAAYEDAGSRLRYTETIVKEKKIFITDTYEIYVGKEFLTAERLEELRRILESGEAGNISEAIEVYKNRNMSRK